MPECALSQSPDLSVTRASCNLIAYNFMKNTKPNQNQPPPAGEPVKTAGEGRIVGLDPHPETFTSAILQVTHPKEARIIVSHDTVPIDSLLEWAKQHLVADQDLVVCEAGSNSFEVIKQLEEIGLCGVCLESQRVGQVRESTFNDDRSSAEKIARIYLSGLAKVVWVPDEGTRQYRELLSAHQEAVRQAPRSKNSLRSSLTEHAITLPKGTRLTKEATETWILESYNWQPIQRTILRRQCIAVREAEAHRIALYRLMCEMIAEDERMLGLMKLLGINVINAFALVATVGDVNRFASPKKLSAFLGLVQRRDRSGKSIDRKKRSPAGRKDVRALLVQAAQAVMNSKRKGDLRAWGWQVFARRGNRCVAIIALARKLAVQVFYQLKGLTPLRVEQEAPLRRKLQVFATHLDKAKIQEMGFRTKTDFIQNLIEKLTLSPNT